MEPCDCGKYEAAHVISISYGQDETLEFTLAYEHRQCLEYLKLGMQGVRCNSCIFYRR